MPFFQQSFALCLQALFKGVLQMGYGYTNGISQVVAVLMGTKWHIAFGGSLVFGQTLIFMDFYGFVFHVCVVPNKGK